MSSKNRFICALLVAQFGIFGFHRFYVGRYLSGLFQLLTFGGIGLWTLLDMYHLYTGKFKDADNLKINGFFMFNRVSEKMGSSP